MPEIINFPADLASTLRRLREDARKKQSDIARTMNVDQSRISRFENGDITPTMDEIAEFVKALEKPEAIKYCEYLHKHWQHLERPEFGHPEISTLEVAEACLQRIDNLVEANPTTGIFEQLDMHRKGLLRAADYLRDRSHKIGFIGSIGVGKSAAMSIMFNLLVPPQDNKPILQRTLLPVGTGGTTICEVEVTTEPDRFAILIEPQTQDEILRIVSDLCADAWMRTHESEKKGFQNRVTWEVERAIRNMAGLKKDRRKESAGQFVTVDPIDDLARKCGSCESLNSEVFGQLNLWRRTRTRLEPTGLEAREAWLQTELKRANNGLVDDVSLPKRIRIVVPFQLLQNTPWSVNLVDTKGVDDSAIRPDLKACIDDDRMVVILCSPFSTIPDISSRQLIEHARETGQEDSLNRFIVLGLAKSGEALQTNTESGDLAEGMEEAYELKADQARTELHKMNFENLPVRFYDAINDDPTALTDYLANQITKLRIAQRDRVREIELAVQQVIKYHEDASLLKCQEEVRLHLLGYLANHRDLPTPALQPHTRLIEALRNTHQRTVWASVRRSGSWPGLDAYYYLGAGTVIDVRKHYLQPLTDLRAVIEQMLSDSSLQLVHQFLSELQKNLAIWEQEFLGMVERAGEGAFLPALKGDDQLWSRCMGEYGRGLGFRVSVSDHFAEWFGGGKYTELLKLLESKVQEAWHTCFFAKVEKLADSLALET